jgi:hypothetical protein
VRPTIQTRTIYRPEQIKALYSPLTEEAKPVSPAFGAAKYESGTLKTMYSDVDTRRNDIIIKLLKHGVDVNAVDSQGNTALDIALEQKIKHQWNFNNSYETVEILQKAGAHANKEHKQKEHSQKKYEWEYSSGHE